MRDRNGKVFIVLNTEQWLSMEGPWVMDKRGDIADRQPGGEGVALVTTQNEFVPHMIYANRPRWKFHGQARKCVKEARCHRGATLCPLLMEC